MAGALRRVLALGQPGGQPGSACSSAPGLGRASLVLHACPSATAPARRWPARPARGDHDADLLLGRPPPSSCRRSLASSGLRRGLRGLLAGGSRVAVRWPGSSRGRPGPRRRSAIIALPALATLCIVASRSASWLGVSEPSTSAHSPSGPAGPVGRAGQPPEVVRCRYDAGLAPRRGHGWPAARPSRSSARSICAAWRRPPAPLARSVARRREVGPGRTRSACACSSAWAAAISSAVSCGVGRGVGRAVGRRRPSVGVGVAAVLVGAARRRRGGRARRWLRRRRAAGRRRGGWGSAWGSESALAGTRRGEQRGDSDD